MMDAVVPSDRFGERLAARRRSARSVLIVEDDPAMQGLVRQLFVSDADFEVVDVVDSAEAALAVAVGKRVDLIILDDRLDGPTRGTNVAPMLRDLAPHVKILLFSATAEPSPDVDATVPKFAASRLVRTARQLLALPQ